LEREGRFLLLKSDRHQVFVILSAYGALFKEPASVGAKKINYLYPILIFLQLKVWCGGSEQ
jgi:hypothetical protein